MIRKIIKIDDNLCNGCGLCADACHEGAIAMENGKAKLIRDDYCDGLGDCLPACPTGAISFEEREALAYDHAAVAANMAKKAGTPASPCAGGGCPGSAARAIARPDSPAVPSAPVAGSGQSRLATWPVQLKLAPLNAPYFNGAKLLIAADCTAYAHGNFHDDFMAGKVTLIGCPKLDEGDYRQKLAAILANNNIKSVTLVRMEVPCCGGLEQALIGALKDSGKTIPWQVVTLSTSGEILI